LGHIAKGTTIRVIGLVLMAFTTGVAVSRAGVIQSTVQLPPVTGAYTLGGLCISAISKCTMNAMVSGFSIVSDTQQSGNESVLVDAVYSADIFTDNGGFPGSFLGSLILSGTANFIYVGRDPSVNALGVFPTILADFDFAGMLNGNTFEVKKDPANDSTGTTSIFKITLSRPVEYDVSGSLSIFAEYSLNGSPFVPAPERTATLTGPTAIPEPGSGVLAGSVLVGVLGIASRRRRIR